MLAEDLLTILTLPEHHLSYGLTTMNCGPPLEPPRSPLCDVWRWTRLNFDLSHPADIILVVSPCLAEPSRVEKDFDEAEVGFLVITVLLEKSQGILHCRVGVTGVA